jgi:Putative peptidoglycan binding domain
MRKGLLCANCCGRKSCRSLYAKAIGQTFYRKAGVERNHMKISKVHGKVFQMLLMGLAGICLTGCAASQAKGPVGPRPAYDRLLLAGDIYVAEAHLRDFGFDPGPVDGLFTAETSAAVQAYQARYGLPVSGLLDWKTRQELLPGFDQPGIVR